MKTSKDRYLTTHVGSMLRPPEIVEFNTKIAAGESYDKPAYEAALKRDVSDVVKSQANCGIDIVSDGEFGKPGWLYVTNRMTGFEARDVERPKVGFRGWDAEGRFRDFYDATPPGRTPTVRQMVCTGPVKYTEEGKTIMRRDVENFKAALKDVNVEEAFLPVVAPCSLTVNYKNEYYKTDEEFLYAVAEALHEEYKIITDAGLLVQTDDAILANLHDPIVDAGIDYRSWVDMNLRALNHALEGIPAEKVRYHLCWGSWPGPHTTDVPLREIVDLMLSINCMGYSIEGANPRHEWEWTVWQDTKLPEGKVLIPGVLESKTNFIEHPELIAQRLGRYAKLVGRENVIAGSDCGYGTWVGQAAVEPEIVWAKLAAMAEGARLASKQFWG